MDYLTRNKDLIEKLNRLDKSFDNLYDEEQAARSRRNKASDDAQLTRLELIKNIPDFLQSFDWKADLYVEDCNEPRLKFKLTTGKLKDQSNPREIQKYLKALNIDDDNNYSIPLIVAKDPSEDSAGEGHTLHLCVFRYDDTGSVILFYEHDHIGESAKLPAVYAQFIKEFGVDVYIDTSVKAKLCRSIDENIQTLANSRNDIVKFFNEFGH